MMQVYRPLFVCLLLALQSQWAISAEPPPPLPDWQVLEFEETAFWATANSRLELTPSTQDDALWLFEANSSVPGNSEQVTMQLNPITGGLTRRERVSHGKEDSRFKSYDYANDHLLRERREPRGGNAGANLSPTEWALASQTKLFYPDSAQDLVITNPYLLILLAARLQEEGLEATRQVLVHTDENFYRATLTCGRGIPVKANYQQKNGDDVSGMRETMGVAIRVKPEGSLVDKDDFSLLGLRGDVIIFFDKETALPLQVRGEAPRIGQTAIDLKSVTMRPSQS